MSISGYNAVLKLNMQRYICKCCNKTFMAKTISVNKNCSIYNPIYAAASLSTKKISEKGIAEQLNTSHNTVNRIVNSSFTQYKVNTNYLSESLCFDKFKSTKNADYKINSLLCNCTNEIIEGINNKIKNKGCKMNCLWLSKFLLL